MSIKSLLVAGTMALGFTSSASEGATYSYSYEFTPYIVGSGKEYPLYVYGRLEGTLLGDRKTIAITGISNPLFTTTQDPVDWGVNLYPYSLGQGTGPQVQVNGGFMDFCAGADGGQSRNLYGYEFGFCLYNKPAGILGGAQGAFAELMVSDFYVGYSRTENFSARNWSISGPGIPVPVPIPAGGLFLLTGLGGVVALKRRKKWGSPD